MWIVQASDVEPAIESPNTRPLLSARGSCAPTMLFERKGSYYEDFRRAKGVRAVPDTQYFARESCGGSNQTTTVARVDGVVATATAAGAAL